MQQKRHSDPSQNAFVLHKYPFFGLSEEKFPYIHRNFIINRNRQCYGYRQANQGVSGIPADNFESPSDRLALAPGITEAHRNFAACQQSKEHPRGTHRDVALDLKIVQNDGINKVDNRGRAHVPDIRMRVSSRQMGAPTCMKENSPGASEKPLAASRW